VKSALQSKNFSLDAQMQGLNRALGDIEKCSQDDQEACARDRAYNAQQQQMMGILEGLNAQDEIRAGVARDQQRLMDSNTASQYRQDAQGYFDYADRARRAGDSGAAQSWQEKGDSALDWSYRYSR
jgi:hypothetical protein